MAGSEDHDDGDTAKGLLQNILERVSNGDSCLKFRYVSCLKRQAFTLNPENPEILQPQCSVAASASLQRNHPEAETVGSAMHNARASYEEGFTYYVRIQFQLTM